MSKISWTKDTWNVFTGCEEVSPGCDNCYAKMFTQMPRLQKFPQYQAVKAWDGTVYFAESQLRKPFKMAGEQKLFPSMSDPHQNNVILSELDQMYAVMALCPQHIFQILTKRPHQRKLYLENLTADRLFEATKLFWIKETIPKRVYRPLEQIREYFDSLSFPLSNVWQGTSTENQEMLDIRAPILSKTLADIRFLSCEPLLTPLDLRKHLGLCVGCQTCDFQGGHRIAESKIHWVIVGGESVTLLSPRERARYCYIDWLRDIAKQCQQANIPVFVKQLGTNPMETYYVNGVPEYRLLTLKKDRQGENLENFPEDLRSFRYYPDDIALAVA
jgi:protein gp37